MSKRTNLLQKTYKIYDFYHFKNKIQRINEIKKIINYLDEIILSEDLKLLYYNLKIVNYLSELTNEKIENRSLDEINGIINELSEIKNSLNNKFNDDTNLNQLKKVSYKLKNIEKELIIIKRTLNNYLYSRKWDKLKQNIQRLFHSELICEEHKENLKVLNNFLLGILSPIDNFEDIFSAINGIFVPCKSSEVCRLTIDLFIKKGEIPLDKIISQKKMIEFLEKENIELQLKFKL